MGLPETNKPAVGVVIVNHNLKESLRETLECFRKVNYPGLQIVVSDNASSDGAQEMVRKEFWMHLLAYNTRRSKDMRGRPAWGWLFWWIKPSTSSARRTM